MRGLRASLLAVGLAAPIAVAPPGAAWAQAPGYRAAVAAFDNELTLPERMRLQIRLAAGGYTNHVPLEHLDPYSFKAIKAFQSATGFEPTGRFTNPAAERLRDDTQDIMRMWGFGWVGHPSRTLRMWAPLALLGGPVPTRYGAHYDDGAGRLELDLLSYPDSDARKTFDDSMRDWRRRGALVNFSLFAGKEWPYWWVASVTTPDGHDHYYRYHQDGDAVTGFALEWNNAAGDVNGDRIAVILSGAVGATMADMFFPDPPAFLGQAQGETAQEQPALRQAAVPVAPPPRAPDAPRPDTSKPDASSPGPEKAESSSGSGFFVSGQGHLVTNAHVVKDCRTLTAKGHDGTTRPARLLARDEGTDLALLQIDALPSRVAALRPGVRLGEPVEAFGFPYSGLLAPTGNFTTGGVTALSGLGNDSGFLQTSAPVQAGNSGGPLLDGAGNVVGVVTAKLNAMKMLAAADDLPQNVNFAIKASRVVEFLASNGVNATVAAAGAALPTADVAEQAQLMSGLVVCGR